jgi:competence protein ComEC
VAYLHQIPLARLVIPLMLGIAAALSLSHLTLGNWFYLMAALLIGLMALLSSKGQNWSAWFGFTASVFFILLGIQLVEINTAKGNSNYFGNHLQDGNYIVGTITQPPQVKAKSVKTVVEVESIKTKQGWVKANGSILAYFEPNDMSYALAYGDKLLLNISVDEVKPPTNPGQFDYKAFLARKGIYHQAFIKEADYTFIESHTGNPIMQWVYNIRDYMRWLLGEHGLKGSQLAVASALVLGYDDDVDPDLLQAYSASGTLHVLSVSGMHAGLVFILLSGLLAFAGQSKKARFIRVVVIVVSLFLYALLTGFSPPVLRAAVMFSLLAIGQSSTQYTNNYNILAGSCLLMLLSNPFLLADVGFQLSYSAVLGIALFYPCLHRAFDLHERLEIYPLRKPLLAKGIIKPYNWLVTSAWSVMAMSVAAQLATLPLGLYYFHQFPVYFIAANLIIIPLSVLCIWGGMLLLLFSWIPMVNNATGWLLNNMVQLLNNLALYSEGLPYATWGNFKLANVEVFALYVIIIAALIALKLARKRWLYAALATSVVFMGFRIMQKNEDLHQQKLVVYNINRASAVEVINGDKSLLIADTLSTPGSINYKFNIEAGQWYFGISDRVVNAPSTIAYHKPPILVAGDKTILLYTPKFNSRNTTINGKVDYIFISGSPYLDYGLIEKLKPTMVVFDGSNKPAKVKAAVKKLGVLGISCYNTAIQGAWIVDL